VSGVAPCSVCRDPYPVELLQEHHINPQAAGGSDAEDNLTLLCAGCHHNLHRISEMILRGAVAKAEDVAALAYRTNTAAINAILRLAKICAREMKALREGDADLPPMVMVTMELPRDVVTRLKLMAYEWNGSKPGLRPFLRHHLTVLSEGMLSRETVRSNTDESADDATSPKIQITQFV